MGDERGGERERRGGKGGEGRRLPPRGGLDVITAKCVGPRRATAAATGCAAPSVEGFMSDSSPSHPLALPRLRHGGRSLGRSLIIVKAGSRNAKISPHPEIYNAAPRRRILRPSQSGNYGFAFARSRSPAAYISPSTSDFSAAAACAAHDVITARRPPSFLATPSARPLVRGYN